MKRFGPDGNPDIPPTDTPIGQYCEFCEEVIIVGDSGLLVPGGQGEVPYHLNCFLRTILGSVGHQRKTCSCHGGSEEDPEGMTPREAADAAVDEWRFGRST